METGPLKEPVLEPWLRALRLRRVRRFVLGRRNLDLLDVGCGWEAKLLREFSPHLRQGVGIDFKAPVLSQSNLRTFPQVLDRALPFADGSFDVVTMLAVLEHLSHPLEILRETHRVLRPGGSLLLTTPTVWSQPVLEFLAFGLHIVSPEEIADHKNYFDRAGLRRLADLAGLKVREHRYFELWMNNWLHAEKTRA